MMNEYIGILGTSFGLVHYRASRRPKGGIMSRSPSFSDALVSPTPRITTLAGLLAPQWASSLYASIGNIEAF